MTDSRHRFEEDLAREPLLGADEQLHLLVQGLDLTAEGRDLQRVRREHPVAAACLQSTDPCVVAAYLDLLEALAGHTAIAMENARLYEEAKRINEFAHSHWPFKTPHRR